MSTIPLVNGTGSIPVRGLGTFKSTNKEGEAAIEYAVRVGYRHIDTAMAYGNQEEVGAALKKVIPSVVKREELFIVTKLWNTFHHPEDVEPDIDLSLKQLGLDYLDLYLMHWPVSFAKPKPKAAEESESNGFPGEIDLSVTVADTWLAMHKLLAAGKVKNIGVSNFTIDHLKKLIAVTGIKPAVNQVELHPYLLQNDLLEYCKQEGIAVTGYFPFGGDVSITGSNLLENPVVKEVAANYPGASPAQILLNWGISRGYSVIPKSIKNERIKSNFAEISLKTEDIEKISSLGSENPKRFVLPIAALGWKIDVFGTPEEKDLPKVLIA